MIELHGWLAIGETYKDEDLFPQSEIDRINKTVKEIILKCDYKITLQYSNGCAYINTLHCSNHRTPEVDTIIKAYKHISEVATGSYGMIYLKDDEDKDHYNDFQVYVFKKGKCIQRDDIDFSPCIPTIEDEVIRQISGLFTSVESLTSSFIDDDKSQFVLHKRIKERDRCQLILSCGLDQPEEQEMGTVFKFGQFEVDIDVERTRLFYDKARLVSNACECSGCRNFEKAVSYLPSEVVDAFEKMGIDMRKVCECYSNVYEDGKVLYGGFFHVCGRLLRGESAWEKKSENHKVWNDDAAFALNDDFRISFQEEVYILETGFPLPALQLEFSAWIPWCLDEAWD